MGYPKSSLRFDRLAKWVSLSYRCSKIRSICDGTNIDTQNLRNESSLTKLQIRRQVFRRGFSEPAIVSAETHSRLGTRLGDPKLFHYAQFSITCLKKNSIASTFNHCAVWLVNKSLNQSDAKSKQIAPSRFPARGTVLTFHWFLVKLSYILIGRSDYSHYNGFYDTTKGAVILKKFNFYRSNITMQVFERASRLQRNGKQRYDTPKQPKFHYLRFICERWRYFIKYLIRC